MIKSIKPGRYPPPGFSMGIYAILICPTFSLDIKDAHKLTPTVHYLKDKYHAADANWRKEEKALVNVNRLTNHHETEEKYNIEAPAFCEISVCSYRQNHLEQALQYAESTLEAFIENGKRPRFNTSPSLTRPLTSSVSAGWARQSTAHRLR